MNEYVNEYGSWQGKARAYMYDIEPHIEVCVALAMEAEIPLVYAELITYQTIGSMFAERMLREAVRIRKEKNNDRE